MYAREGNRIRAFVGRGREFAALSSALDAADGGRGTLCLVSGEPGVGKSRLLAEFTNEHAARRASIHWGLAWEAGGAPGYWPWIQILRSVLSLERARQVLHEQPHVAASLAELAPELVPSAARQSARLEPEQARFRLMDAMSTLLLAAAADSPQMLIFEDLHATDADSLAMFEFAARQLHASRTLIVGSFRESEMQRPRVGNIIARLRRSAIQLGLRRLERDEVREYLQVATGERPLEQHVTELMRLTEGHPLYLAEVVQLGRARGNLRHAPQSIRTAILERAADLPEATRTLLGMASVLGRNFNPEALAELAGSDTISLEETLAPAIASGLLEVDASGGLRFEHMLVREAFHDDLPIAERRRLHERESQRMRRRAASGTMIPWAAFAQHLEESGASREDAVEAWCNAARQADARHAFDDAAMCYDRALRTQGDAQDAQPRARAPLLLELAAAQIRAGDLDAGRRNSSEAFRIGETLGDTALMADAALTYGSIFTFGSVDPRLVRLLKDALARLEPCDTDRRARLEARLAAAMQPAPDPEEPIALAREAIALARINGDPQTLLTTLRSAVSAMMDFGDPAERLALNGEHVQLARQLGDTPECMRGYMRAAVDAMEIADAATLDDAIEQCDALAERLAMPHYQWTAASFRAMRATMRGEFAAAEAALARAGQLADRAQDSHAVLRLMTQQLSIAEMTGDVERLAALCTRLERHCADMPQTDLYIKPDLLAIGLRHLGKPAEPALLDEAYLRNVIRFADMGALSSLGEYLAALNDKSLADLAYQSLLRYRDRCGHWGLLGLRWMGPMTRCLGHLAAASGRPGESDEHFGAALGVARRMGARAWIARIALEWAETQQARGEGARVAPLLDEAEALATELGMRSIAERAAACRAAAATPRGADEDPRPPQSAGDGIPAMAFFRLAREGEVWVCECDARVFRLRDSRGVQMLARLVASPGKEIHVLDLMGTALAGEPLDTGDSGAALDEKARREYRKRLESLREELEEAEARHDLAAAENAREEIEQLTSELSRAFGLGGRARRTGSNVERARVNVQRRLKHALDRIAQECPTAGKHLEWAIRTGSYCSYQPG